MADTPKASPKDLPWDQIVEQTTELTKNPYCFLFQKFTCENCGNRLEMEIPNTFYTSGSCDKCNHVTSLTKNGCGYTAIYTNDLKLIHKFHQMMYDASKISDTKGNA